MFIINKEVSALLLLDLSSRPSDLLQRLFSDLVCRLCGFFP